MELTLKMPNKKPPFIGIVFTSVREAASLHEDLVNKPIDGLYQLTFIGSSKGIKVRISCDKAKHFFIYDQVKYDPVQLENFLYINRKCQDYNFGHILRDFERDTLVCTRERYIPFLIKIHGVFRMPDS